MVQLEPSSPKQIETIFDDIVIRIEEVDKNCRPSNIVANRMTIYLNNGYKVYVEEYLKKGKVDYFHYNVVNASNQILFKVHSEPHDNKAYQTSTEPYHIHKGDLRLPNKHYQSLMDVMKALHTLIILAPSVAK